MSSTSLTALPQFVLQRESYLRLDGKKHILKGREHRRNRNRKHLYTRVAFRMVFTSAGASLEQKQLENLKQAIDDLRLQGITTKVEGATVLIMTDFWCTTSTQRVKKLKIHLYKQVRRAIDSLEKPLVNTKPVNRRAIRNARQHSPRRYVPADVTITPEAPAPTTVESAADDISALATTLSQRVLTSCAQHHGLDTLESELASGLLVAAS